MKGGHGIKETSPLKRKKWSLVTREEEEENMRGGSLTRFRTDEWYDQHGNDLMMDTVRGGLQGLKRTRNPLKLPSNTLSGLKTGMSRGVKRKAEQVIKKEITKQAKKALDNKDVKKAVRVASALFPKQVKRARDTFGV